jgi:O-acetyl-ADP-ribose deacetylase (regulator of RNase III)
MIYYIARGDIFKVPGVTSYAHGCNCAGAMGKGIALQFKQKFPKMYNEYHQLCLSGCFNPGDVFPYEYAPGCFVYNLATQKHYAIRGQLAKLPHIRSSVKKMLEHAHAHKVKAIALPKIGAGLGGLNWNDVKQTLESVAASYPDVELYVVEEYAPF